MSARSLRPVDDYVQVAYCVACELRFFSLASDDLPHPVAEIAIQLAEHVAVDQVFIVVKIVSPIIDLAGTGVFDHELTRLLTQIGPAYPFSPFALRAADVSIRKSG